MTFTFYSRSIERHHPGCSWPGPPTEDEILFTCEARDMFEAQKMWRAFAKITNIDWMPNLTFMFEEPYTDCKLAEWA